MFDTVTGLVPSGEAEFAWPPDDLDDGYDPLVPELFAPPVDVPADELVGLALGLGPGWQAAALLSAIDTAALSPSARIDYLAACEQLTAWSSALAAPVLLAHVDAARDGAATVAQRAGTNHSEVVDLADSAARAELEVELALSSRVVRSRLTVARQLATRLRATAEALALGRISYLHALTLVEAVADLDDDAALVVESSALAKGEGRPLGDLRRACRAAVDRVDPQAAARRHARARTDRGMIRWAEPDGMAALFVRASAPDVTTMWAALTLLAGADDTDDPRSLNARRVDALVGLCLAAVAPDPDRDGVRPPRGPAASVTAEVVVDLATLLGLADNPAELRGYGPVPAGVAREWLQRASTWRRLVTDPVTGHLLDYGPLVRHAPPRLRAYLDAAHDTCAFPGCQQPARRADLDHEPPWQPDGSGGSTSAAQLRPLCRHHHRIKTYGWWERTASSDATATTVWTSPSGRQHCVDVSPVLSTQC